MYSCCLLDLFEYNLLQNTSAKITHYFIGMRKLRKGANNSTNFNFASVNEKKMFILYCLELLEVDKL
ncbi:hypothetical protein Bacsa_0931 [Phocaeicola salanitronis DSM 18170]|uniref:Uncharacterized protein n=1 Tax=Phocaeicola salanitronis (strain DSM 18170 / JCM 13657 / CCUG 60908 / BL78) TaxID=667015 RepID=F0R3B3_PHOSB|nr:hypothetical protein Bacsa_0931 [Phocaeicola salanitronis DSM 18170]